MTRLPSPVEFATGAAAGSDAGADVRWLLDPDSPAAGVAAGVGGRVLLGVDVIQAIGPETLRRRDHWLPVLPLSETGEAKALGGMVADGSFGEPLECDVTVAYGCPPWDPQTTEPYPLSPFEAAVWGQDLVEQVVGDRIPTPRWVGLASERPSYVGDTTLPSSGLCRLRVVHAERFPGPVLAVTLWFDHGHVSVRQPFAPGRLSIWDGRRLELRSGNGPPLGPRAGNDAWPARPLTELATWALGGTPPGHPDGLRSRALSVVARVGGTWPRGPE